MSCKKNSFLILLFCLSVLVVSQEKEVSIPVCKDSLYGTLLSAQSKYLCIIHSGSGPTDRNGNNPYGGDNNSLKKLADSLYAHQISSFRYDKRGVGKSKDALGSEDSLTIFDYVKDLNGVIDFFSKPPYNYRSFVLIGHSEGALISTLAAQKNQMVSKLILIAGAGYRGDTILKRQLSYLSDKPKAIIFSLLDTLSAGKTIDNVPPMLNIFFRESIQRYMISWLPIDPAVELSKTKQKALIIQGNHDIQVSIDNAERLHAFKKNSELIVIDGMNHILVDAPTDKKENKETYNNPDLPLSAGLIPGILKFLNK